MAKEEELGNSLGIGIRKKLRCDMTLLALTTEYFFLFSGIDRACEKIAVAWRRAARPVNYIPLPS